VTAWQLSFGDDRRHPDTVSIRQERRGFGASAPTCGPRRPAGRDGTPEGDSLFPSL